MLDLKICERLTSLIEKLATSGKQEIDKKLFKELVANAGKSEEYIKFSLERIFQHLEQKHSEIRLGAFLIVDELFRRSQYFRELLLDDFHTFLELTVESNPSKLLPPPLPAAKALKQKVLQAIQKWYSKFGEEHKRLALSYNFLKNSLKVDFQDALKRNATELQAVAAEQERQRKVMEKKVAAIKEEISEHGEEIQRLTVEMDNCFCLLIPKPEDTFGIVSETNNKNIAFDMREHGLQTKTAITLDLDDIKLKSIKETEDNVAIIDNLRDFSRLLKNRYLAMIKKWVVTASKANDQTLFREVMDMKNATEKQLERFSLITVSPAQNNESSSDDDADSDSDFEDVPPKEGYEENTVAPPALPCPSDPQPCSSKQALKTPGWSLCEVHQEDDKDPTTLAATLKSLTEKKDAPKIPIKGKLPHTHTITRPQEETPSLTSENSIDTDATRKGKLMKIAPKLPFDIDLYHWEDKDLKAPSVEIVETDGHKFWTPSQDREGEVIDNPEGVSVLRTRVIEFSGKFEPVKWSCRAPLPSGILCPRKDREKCPLHGKVIARDIMGNPTDPEDIQRLEEMKELEEKNKPPEWQDPEFLKDIQAATGMDLTIRPPKRGGKKKQQFSEKFPGLTDVDKKRNTPRTRLEKKVFNKTAMKRVAQTMDDINSKRFKDKYGDQWNYSMNDD